MLRERRDAELRAVAACAQRAALRCRRGRAHRAPRSWPGLRRDSTNPNSIASQTWWRTAFPDHPYGRPTSGTLESVPADHRRRSAGPTRGACSTRDKLKIAAVGDIDAATLGQTARSRVRRAARQAASSTPVPDVSPSRPPAAAIVVAARRAAVRGAVRRRRRRAQRPRFHPGLCGQPHPRRRLVHLAALRRGAREARPRLRRLLVSARDSQSRAAVHGRRPQTRADRTGEALDADRDAKSAAWSSEGPTADELAKAKAYLKGSYALNFDTSTKIASVLLQHPARRSRHRLHRQAQQPDRRRHDRRRPARRQAAGRGRHAGDRGRPAQGPGLEGTGRLRRRCRRLPARRAGAGPPRLPMAAPAIDRAMRAPHQDFARPLLARTGGALSLAARAPRRRRAAAAAAAREARRHRRRSSATPRCCATAPATWCFSAPAVRASAARRWRSLPAMPSPASARCAIRRACISWTISIPTATARCWQRLPLKTSRFVAVSKSGGTGETLMQTIAALDAVKAAKLDPHAHFLGISEPAKPGKANGLRDLLSATSGPHDGSRSGRRRPLFGADQCRPAAGRGLRSRHRRDPRGRRGGACARCWPASRRPRCRPRSAQRLPWRSPTASRSRC